MVILPLTYLGNIHYFTKLCFYECVIDTHENYRKQSYRSRCDILSANGPMALSVNVAAGGSAVKTPVSSIRIDYSKRWQHQHWQSIVSAYRNSPYFDYYYDRFEPFYGRRYDLLADFNRGLLETVLELLGSSVRPQFSESYIEPASVAEQGITDMRDLISPKVDYALTDPDFSPKHYWQVFSDRQNFVPNLSIIDLLFCEGPESLNILRESDLPHSLTNG